MNSLFAPIKFGAKQKYICSESEAMRNLELAATRLVKEACWAPYHTKINALRIPLIQLKLARKNKQKL